MSTAEGARAGARVGILGGTFDPVHEGHLHVARTALARLGLDAVRFLPAPRAPHKRDHVLLPIADRLEMLEAALAGEPRLAVERHEVERGGPGYTYDTLRALAAAEPGSTFLFLIGGDSLRDLPKWHRARDLVREFTIVTVPRARDEDVDALLAPCAAAFPPEDVARLRAHVLRVEPLPISATDVRARVRAGEPIDGLVPPPVAELIRTRGHYRDAAPAAPPRR